MLQTDIEDADYLGRTRQPESARTPKATLAISADALTNALADVVSVVEKVGTIPILTCLRIVGSDGQIAITGTDMEIVTDVRVAAEVAEFGPIVIAAAPLYDAARKLPQDTRIEMAIVGDAVKLRAGRFSISMPLQPLEDFPSTGVAKFPCEFSLPAAALLRLLDKTRWAASPDQTHYNLSGVFLHVQGDYLRAAATNVHVLAVAETPLPPAATAMPGVIIPTKTVGAIRKALAAIDCDVTLRVSENRLQLATEQTTITSKLIDGTYPDYERVIPRSNQKALRFVTKPFLSALNIVTGFAEEALYRAITLSLSEGLIVMSSRSQKLGSADAEIGAGDVEYTWPSMEVAFQTRYLSAIVGAIEGDAEMMLSDPQAPALVRDTADDAVQFVVMPYRM